METVRSRTRGRLLFIFAHPDDEAFLAGGTIARHIAEGGRVSLVCATRGERGSQPATPVCPPDLLGEVRQRELEDSCAVLGIDRLELLGYGDRRVAEADFNLTAARIARSISETDPAAVVTFGPDGVSGHRDHVAVHHLTVAAFALVFGPDREPGRGSHVSGHIPRLWFLAPFSAFWRFGPPGEGGPEASIDISEHLTTKLRALLCHRSQRHNVDRVFGRFYDLERLRPRDRVPEEPAESPPAVTLLSREHFNLARGPRPRRRLEASLLGQ